jgi:YD repeat-containing protein
MRKPIIRPFRAVRFDESVAGDVGRLLAPPYDVSSPELIARLHERSPLNMTHLEHVRTEDGADPHALVAARYRRWLHDGVLRQDDRPALYRYDHTFRVAGRERTRRGIFAAVRLAHWDEHIVLPHERTFPGPVAERRGRLRAVRANISPVYLLASDPTGRFGELLNSGGERLVETTDPDGESHVLTRIEQDRVDEIVRAIAGTKLFVADGHHRYEAALAHRDEERAAHGGATDGGSEFVLALIADAADADVLILPTHRLVNGPPDVDPDVVRSRLAAHFTLEPIQPETDSPRAADDFVAVVRFAGEASAWRLGLRPGSPHTELMPANRDAAWRRLPAAILESVVFEHVLGMDQATIRERVTFTHDAGAANAAVDDGQAQIAFLLPAPSVADLVTVAEAGDRMPPKSTYFYPKVPAGLVIYDFAQS